MAQTPTPPPSGHDEPSTLTEIDLRQGWQVDYFTEKIGLSREALAKIIESTGPRVQDVLDYLKRYGPPATTE